MATKKGGQPPDANRVRAEEANAWARRWQPYAPSVLIAVLGNKSLTIHAVPGGTLLYRLVWATEVARLYEGGIAEELYRFHNVQNALVFLDALLTRHVAQVGLAFAAVGGTPLRTPGKHPG